MVPLNFNAKSDQHKAWHNLINKVKYTLKGIYIKYIYKEPNYIGSSSFIKGLFLKYFITEKKYLSS